MEQQPNERRTAGLIGSVSALLRSLLAILQIRLELLGTEFREEIVRLGLVLVWGYVTMFFATLGAGLLTAAVVLALWDAHRLLALATIGVVFLMLAAFTAWSMAKLAKQKPRLFEASLGELSRDRAQLEK
ncbi:MAG TPA: phage holin family protein [Burkholderiales bacterium]|nr:phage holin family protein [Burkholderiales bacterium]